MKLDLSPTIRLLAILIGLSISGPAQGEVESPPPAARHVLIVTGANRTGPEMKGAELLEKRILKRSAVTVTHTVEGAILPDADVTFVLGTLDSHALVAQLVSEFGAVLPALPGSGALHPEGFAIKSGLKDGRRYVLIAGTDPPGVIYGTGWILRAMSYRQDSVVVPDLDVTEKPAFWIRGGNPRGPGSRAREFAELRAQTREEGLEIMEDLLLLGTNYFEGDPEQLRADYGALTYTARTINQMPEGFPVEWAADDGRATKFVCPSVPDARKALLDSFDEMFRTATPCDFFMTNSADIGGCSCGRCAPWGATYIKLLHEVANLLHTHLPDTKVLATNQDLSNEGNQAVFDYLNNGDSSWLYAIRYGPASDEMQTYIRGPVNPRWFEYEGFGPLGNYLKYMHHALPRTTNVVLFTDITHWMQAQYGVPHPDLALAAVYGRRSWNARPRTFHGVAREIMHYAIGDMHYTEGMHDDFNKWLWYRMLWNPNQSAEALTKEYCGYWFGDAAAEEAARAIFLMEQTLEKPLAGNPGIAEAVELLRSAGRKIPDNLLRTDWRWRVIMAKALMDHYLQLACERGERLKQEAGGLLARVDEAPRAQAERALVVLDQPVETDAMRAIREEALIRGEESNSTIGYREPACFIADQYDAAEVGWWKKTLRDALDSGSEARVQNAARMILRYEDPGEGGYYDDLGWPEESRHLVQGETQWGFRPAPGPARQSHYNMAYGYTPRQSVTFAYDGLDAEAAYVVRISVAGGAGGRRGEGLRLSQGLSADGTLLRSGLPIGAEDTTYFEIGIPPDLTRDGAVRIALEPESDTMAITTASEIWLMRKDKMPWKAQPE